MKVGSNLTAILAVCAVCACAPRAYAQIAPQSSGDAPKSIVDYAQSTLIGFSQSPSIVAQVEAQNARRVSVEQLKAADERWAASKGVEPYMWDLMRNQLAFTLVSFQFSNKFIVEAFVMDRRGAIIGETNRTSTYYKGEADKFTAAWADGAGALWFGPAEYDESTGEVVIQVSVPVKRGDRAIGVITYGISLDRWEQRGKAQ